MTRSNWPATSCAIEPIERGTQTLEATWAGNDDFDAASASAEQHVNELPIAHADETTANEDQPFTVNATDGVLANDEPTLLEKLFMLLANWEALNAAAPP